MAKAEVMNINLRCSRSVQSSKLLNIKERSFPIVGLVTSLPGVTARPSLLFSLSMSRTVTYTCAHSRHVTLSATITTAAHKIVTQNVDMSIKYLFLISIQRIYAILISLFCIILMNYCLMGVSSQCPTLLLLLFQAVIIIIIISIRPFRYMKVTLKSYSKLFFIMPS